MQLKEYSGCIITIIVILSLLGGCSWYKSYQRQQLFERKRAKAIREAFIKDSLKHDPKYQDSIKQEELLWDKLLRMEDYYQEREIVGIVWYDHTVYHSCFHDIKEIPVNKYSINVCFTIEDINNLRFITKKEADDLGIKECEECEEIKRIYEKYKDEEF